MPYTLLRISLILVGMIAARQTKGLLRLYLILASLSVGVLELALWHFGMGMAYSLVYILVRVPECTAMLWLAGPRKAALFGTAGLVLMASFGIETTVAGIWVCLVEGAVFAFCGLSLGLRAQTKIDAILAILWLLLAVFDFGWAIGWELPTWKGLNWWWPSAMCMAGFILVACYSHERIRFRPHSGHPAFLE